LHKTFAAEDRVRFVSITTDPQKDTPAVLQEYASRFQADARWHFLTGEKDAIWKLSRDGFKPLLRSRPAKGNRSRIPPPGFGGQKWSGARLLRRNRRGRISAIWSLIYDGFSPSENSSLNLPFRLVIKRNWMRKNFRR
jgi:hypothetical protein